GVWIWLLLLEPPLLTVVICRSVEMSVENCSMTVPLSSTLGSTVIVKPEVTTPGDRLVVVPTLALIVVCEDFRYAVCRATCTGTGWWFSVATEAEVSLRTLPCVDKALMIIEDPAHLLRDVLRMPAENAVLFCPATKVFLMP